MKKLLSFLAIAGISFGPVIATVACAGNNVENNDNNNDTQPATSDVIKVTELGGIVVPSDQKTVSKLDIAKAVVAVNPGVKLEDVTITGKYTNHNKGTANVHVKGYFTAIQVSFTFGEATENVVKITDIGEISIPSQQEEISIEDIAKAVVAVNPGVKLEDVSITDKKVNDGQGTANVHVEGYVNAVQVSFVYYNSYSGDDINSADVSWALDAYSSNPNKSIWLPLSKVKNENGVITLDLTNKDWSRIIWTGMLNANDEQALKDFDTKRIWTILHFEGNPGSEISSLISNYLSVEGNQLTIDTKIQYLGDSELSMKLDENLLSQTKSTDGGFRTLGLQASEFKFDNLNIKFYDDSSK